MVICRGRGREGVGVGVRQWQCCSLYLVEIIVEARARVDHVDGRGGLAGIMVKPIVYAVAALHRDSRKRYEGRGVRQPFRPKTPDTFWSSLCGCVGGKSGNRGVGGLALEVGVGAREGLRSVTGTGPRTPAPPGKKRGKDKVDTRTYSSTVFYPRNTIGWGAGRCLQNLCVPGSGH